MAEQRGGWGDCPRSPSPPAPEKDDGPRGPHLPGPSFPPRDAWDSHEVTGEEGAVEGTRRSCCWFYRNHSHHGSVPQPHVLGTQTPRCRPSGCLPAWFAGKLVSVEWATHGLPSRCQTSGLSASVLCPGRWLRRPMVLPVGVQTWSVYLWNLRRCRVRVSCRGGESRGKVGTMENGVF